MLLGGAFPQSQRLIEQAPSESIAPHLRAGVWSKKQGTLWTAGVGEYEVFDLASITKVLCTTTLLALLVDRGWVSIQDPIKKYLKDYPDDQLLVRHCLSHTGGLPAWLPFYEMQKKSGLKQAVCEAQREFPIGERVVYSDLSFLLLGFVIEEIVQESLDSIFDQWIRIPAGLRQTRFGPIPFEQRKKIAPTENSLTRGQIQGIVHDDNCLAFGEVSGHAGLFGTVEDLFLWLDFWNRGGISKTTRQLFWTEELLSSGEHRGEGSRRALGFDMPQGEQPSFGKYFSKQSIGHLGFTGTSIWFDPVLEVGVALLTNRVNPTRDNIKIREFRTRFHESVYREISRK